MQFDNQSTNALGRVFQNLATLPARARLMEQENQIKALMNRSLLDSRASTAELNRVKAAREQQAFDLMNRATELFAKDRDAANFYALQGGGKAYTPFSNVGNTGYSINEATGVQTLGNPNLARVFKTKTIRTSGGGSGGNGPRLNPSQIKVFYPTPLLDDQGKPVINNSTLQPIMTTDDKAMLQDMIQMQQQGYPSTLEGFIAFKGGLPSPVSKAFTGVPQPATPAATQPASLPQTPPIQQTYVPPEQTNKDAAIESIRKRYLNGEISKEDARQALAVYGY
ncbi:hypothetical protein [Parasutterella secunda]|uniref:SHOCT domain-containing protein n=1 Tax=Parasutterella secunda TaxID=626947 RepID=A0ABS2GTY5_9BURK|nr:hypothetical protein [Parasutterella secunda]MBM6928192.1 hypothetical protein [Parasutterella secunda]